MEKTKPLTAAQILLMEPAPFVDSYSYMRDRRGNILFAPGGTEPLSKRPKRIWSFEGVHQVMLEDGTIEDRPGRYITKQERK